jgi:hypothetical protein
MPDTHTAEAIIHTADPARYISRLRGHTAKMGEHTHFRPRHGRRPPDPDSTHTPPRVTHAEWTDTHGTVTMNWGEWTVQAAARTLTVRAQAADEESLKRIQDMLTVRLESFGRREHLRLTWQAAPLRPPR